MNRLVNLSTAVDENRKKRRLEEAADRPVTARCEQCNERFDVNDNDDEACSKMRHAGEFSISSSKWVF